jgi:leucyl aminopeptidase
VHNKKDNIVNCYTQKQANVFIQPVFKKNFADWLSVQSEKTKNWLQSTRFCAEPGTACFTPNQNGNLEHVFLGVADENDYWSYGILPKLLPEGHYAMAPQSEATVSEEHWMRVHMAWGLGSYVFSRYRLNLNPSPQLFLPNHSKSAETKHMVESIFLIRDLINIPAEDLSPEGLVEETIKLAKQFSAKTQVVKGEELAREFPAVYAVGRSSSREPYFVELEWGDCSLPALVLIGKGICFDSGGLDIKNADGMRLMKKDMAGAAHALGLSRLIMAMNLPVHLRLMIPTADNVISGNSFRPGDIIRTRSGLTVEVGNTDAEGRLVLCEALAAATEKKPTQIIDFSSLTGAARVALGPEVAAFFSNQDAMLADLQRASLQAMDPIWALPLYQPYLEYLKSEIADLSNCSNYPFAGAITAALYLQRFVKDVPWAHFDLSAWNFFPKPGRPCGGEAMAIRAVWKYLKGQHAA